MNELFSVLSSTDVENAQASYKSDCDNILGIVRNETGYDQFNNIVNTLVHEWVIHLIRDVIGGEDGKYDDISLSFCNDSS